MSSGNLSNLEMKYKNIERDVDLRYVRDTLTRTAKDIEALPERVSKIRERGYVFSGYLEEKVATLGRQWMEISQTAETQIESGAAELKRAFEGLERNMHYARNAPENRAEDMIKRAQDEVDGLEEKLKSVKGDIEKNFGDVPNNVSQTASQVRTIEGYLDLIEEATFPLQGDEAIFMAVRAQWKEHNKKDDPEGIFYITDQRLVMEQKEKVGKGFLGRGGEMKHEVAWEAPISGLSEAKPEKKGLLGGIDLIHFKFSSGAPFGDTTIEVKGGINANWFAGQLKRAAGGGLEQERAMALDNAVVEAIEDAPSMCGVCGAGFEASITPGMKEIKCSYCGAITRLG